MKKILIKGKTAEEIYSSLNLKEHSVYSVFVKTTERNVEHHAILFTGFKTGSYTYVYNNSYEQPISLTKLHQIRVDKFLITQKPLCSHE